MASAASVLVGLALELLTEEPLDDLLVAVVWAVALPIFCGALSSILSLASRVVAAAPVALFAVAPAFEPAATLLPVPPSAVSSPTVLLPVGASVKIRI